MSGPTPTGQVVAVAIAFVFGLLILVGGGVACQYSQDRKEESMCGPGFYWAKPTFEAPRCVKIQ